MAYVTFSKSTCFKKSPLWDLGAKTRNASFLSNTNYSINFFLTAQIYDKMIVRAKKHLGQHFLNNENIAQRIVNSLVTKPQADTALLEIGAGMGVLTQYLVKKEYSFYVIEIDSESIEYLISAFPSLKIENKLIEGDFLKIDFDVLNAEKVVIIGNFPYNISSQILFKVYENKEKVPEVVGMFQKEVAERIASKPGSKKYGILSVLLQAFYDIEYLFTVDENEFNPPPKVKSAVIRLIRNEVTHLNCDERLFKTVIKTAFNQRRKMLSNSLKQMMEGKLISPELAQKRPEQLSVAEFVDLTNQITK